ncbi:MAG: hypothetical protein AB7O96_08110 [Pseudobdellovibrionaceae bacterium]
MKALIDGLHLILPLVILSGLFAFAQSPEVIRDEALLKDGKMVTFRLVPDGSNLLLELVGMNMQSLKKSDLEVKAFYKIKEKDGALSAEKRLIVVKSEKGSFRIKDVVRPSHVRINFRSRKANESFEMQMD